MSRPEHVNDPITVGEVTVPPGRQARFELPFARLPTGNMATLPVVVVNGRHPGPNVWISGAIHGDELNGVQITRAVLRGLEPRRLRGAVIAVPIVNVLGFISGDRYLPDRRDLNRSFPGSRRGSLAARLADLFMREVVGHCHVGIDLHTAAAHRYNVPQIRADLDDPQTLELARSFGAPFTIHARLRDGSLRQAATERGIKVLLFEAGQANRFDREAILCGVDGVMRVLASLGMINHVDPQPPPTVTVRRTTWVRARRGGIAELHVSPGEEVEAGRMVATIGDATGVRPSTVKAPTDGWVIAVNQNPLVGPGDALVHLATAGEGRDEPAERRRR
ncbi:MAG: deacylase [Acidimicrobiia bacterium]|nr:MAG: deacylase [Acidimicrobiia bacterium]